jgi:GMP synthase-like glutamine amidotransferase
MSSSRLLAVQHEDAAPPGLLAEWARDRGLALDVVRVDQGEALPELEGVAFVVVLGAAASVTDVTVPWLAGELAWMVRADALGVPMLGICFGAQTLAAALGGAVRRAPAPELGWIEVQGCARDPLVDTLSPGPWLAWHEDMIEVPPTASILARNDAGVQAYALGSHLAVQFHPEVTADIAHRWIAEARSDFPSSQVDAAGLERHTAREARSAARRAYELFDGFAARLAVVASRG